VHALDGGSEGIRTMTHVDQFAHVPDAPAKPLDGHWVGLFATPLSPRPASDRPKAAVEIGAANQIPDRARWPIWKGSTRTPVQFQPMPRRAAVKVWHDARRFERQTRQPGKQDGAIGRNGLAILHAHLFDLMDRKTGQLEPTRAEIARAAAISIRSVDRGLAKLKAAGVLNWIRQCTEAIEDGIFRLRQRASAYFVLAQSHWRGFWRRAEAPAPYPEAWGQTPPLPDRPELTKRPSGTHKENLLRGP
jgi:hypothetical protein